MLGFLTGVIAGGLFFVGLRHTVYRQLARANRPSLLMRTSFALRSFLFMAALVPTIVWQPQQLWLVPPGLLVSRSLLLGREGGRWWS